MKRRSWIFLILFFLASSYANADNQIQDELPEHYSAANRANGTIEHWNRLNRPGSYKALLNVDDGLADIYVTSSGEKPGSVKIALLHKNGARFTILPLNYSSKDISFYRFSSSYDVADDKYLLFVPNLPFKPITNVNVPSWENFDAWLLDAKGESIDHIVLPPGPWVDDAHLDTLLLRPFRNFSCGTNCYRSYSLTLSSGVIKAVISGDSTAISKNAMGTYRLSQDRKKWEKIQE